MKTYNVTIVFTEQVLGTVPKDREIYATFVQTKAAELSPESAAEELETVQDVEERGWTGFHQDENGPFLYDYAVKGFFKDAAGMLRRVKSTKSAKITAYKKIIDGLVFVSPRRIHLDLPANSQMVMVERPLRAQTAQGERVSLARSDAAPEGTTINFSITVLDDATITEDVIREWLDYGKLRGIGQWRNSGAGRFDWHIRTL